MAKMPSASKALTSDGGDEAAYQPVGAPSPRNQDGKREHDGLGEIEDTLPLNPSIYDLTVQLFCLAFHKYGGPYAIMNLIMVLALQVLNIVVQVKLLVEVMTLIAKPAVEKMRHYYDDFVENCHEIPPHASRDEVLEILQHWAGADSICEKKYLCEFPLARPPFFFLIVLIWTFYLCHEVKQTMNLTWYVLTLERPVSGSVTIMEQDSEFVITNMGHILKGCLTVCVFIPKFLIAMILWYIGAQWLTATPGVDNLMLNSLALAFICEVDELIFRTCLSEVAKSCVERTKLPLPPFKYTPSVWSPIETVATCVACIAVASGYVYHFQKALPEYRWDLDLVCDAFRHSSAYEAVDGSNGIDHCH
mmetsp:Transcript_32009/g.75034  ORF Transcript_32009/g.75034 Transcript_32009/m.75034 type:complete len:362 (+) Transcript_32009:196-1281(+)